MKPLQIYVGQVCSFETREFLLFIWGEVVIFNADQQFCTASKWNIV